MSIRLFTRFAIVGSELLHLGASVTVSTFRALLGCARRRAHAAQVEQLAPPLPEEVPPPAFRTAGAIPPPALLPALPVAAPITPAARRWKAAVRRISHLLLLRKRWAAIGRVLATQPRSNLWLGLQRHRGYLPRRSIAPTETFVSQV